VAGNVLDLNFVPTTMGLAVLDGPAQGGSAAMWCELFRSRELKDPHYKQTSYKTSLVSGNPACEYSFFGSATTNNGPLTIKNRVVLTVIGDKVFMLYGFAVPDEWEAATATRFINSFRIESS
jgi:hypothetical protein